MRDYDDYGDDSIRLYTPVFQRVIILTAVIVAVPVMMWTITTFVRGYIARPKVPALERVATVIAPARAPTTAAPSPAAPPDQPVAAPSRPDLGTGPDSKKGPPPPATADTAAATALPKAINPSPIQAAPAQTSPAQAAQVQTSPVQTSPIRAPSPAIAARPAAATADTQTASIGTAPTGPASSPAQTSRPADNTAVAAVSTSSDRGLAWPNPNASGARSFSAPAPTATAPPVPPPPQMATTEILPAGEPIRGPIPLPRHRPGIFAMVASGPVPLPRARPGAVPAETSSPVTIPPYHFEPGMGINY
jgi:hypothetical protein